MGISSIKLSHTTKKIKAHIKLPGSKSESNRLLILNALSGNKLTINNLSTARDTQNLVQTLASNNKNINVLDAGTSMRFLLAYYCATGAHKILQGTERMNQRPIAPLVNALSEMGFDIRYNNVEGQAPLEILPVDLAKTEPETFIAGNVSSQFITALLLIGPFLPKGLQIHFTSPAVSRPYIEMTLQLLKHFGINTTWQGDIIAVPGQPIHAGHYTVQADWSSAAYWYSIAFLADEAEIYLEGLKDDWSQGDRAVADWMKRFGIATDFDNGGALVRKTTAEYPLLMKLNFTDNPDLAQTFAAMFAGANICGTFSGIDSLKLKETDRIAALQAELLKMNVHFQYADMYEFYQLKGKFTLPQSPIATYNDHRMAMSFAPLALLGPITIENPGVVEKSYPGFWEDLQLAGFDVIAT
jgi:3-phosphoshikimate 1-carboxyvinyltransferase